MSELPNTQTIVKIQQLLNYGLYRMVVAKGTAKALGVEHGGRITTNGPDVIIDVKHCDKCGQECE